MVRLLVLYSTPENPQAAMASEIGKETIAGVPEFAPTGVRTMSYEVAEV